MWARIQEMAIRREVPRKLRPGSTVEGFTIRGHLPGIDGNRRYRAIRDWQTYEVRQFLDVRTPAFLRWQQQARYAHQPQHPFFVRACAEWEGGAILPDPRLPSLAAHFEKKEPRREQDLDLAYRLAVLLRTLHESGTAHLNLTPRSVLVDTKTNTPLLRHFGQSLRSGWQDLWASCNRDIPDWRYRPPRCTLEKNLESAMDVFAFGCLLHRMLAGSHAALLGWWSSALAPVRATLDALRKGPAMPEDIRELLLACLELRAANRPTMLEVEQGLASHASEGFEVPPETSGRETPLPDTANRIMTFVKPDQHAQALFESAVAFARESPSAFLFVSIIPVNLACGEMERFKAQLFRVLGKGLRQCRANMLPWGLTLLENVDPERAARRLACRYEPDQIVCGVPSPKGFMAGLNNDLVGTLEATPFPIRFIASGDI